MRSVTVAAGIKTAMCTHHVRTVWACGRVEANAACTNILLAAQKRAAPVRLTIPNLRVVRLLFKLVLKAAFFFGGGVSTGFQKIFRDSQDPLGVSLHRMADNPTI